MKNKIRKGIAFLDHPLHDTHSLFLTVLSFSSFLWAGDPVGDFGFSV
jgi:hypothetical protein